MPEKPSSCRHFSCTLCGKCCYGWLPLTVADALSFAHLFPLAMVWTIYHPNSRTYALAKSLGAELTLGGRRKIAIQAVPTVYLPPAWPCPALKDHQCGIHETKPQRCRTMPFYPYKEEDDQLSLLIPRQGWTCDVSPQAEAVYQNKKILSRADFDAERRSLLAQQPLIRRMIETLFQQNPLIHTNIARAAQMKIGGRVVTPFLPLLRYDDKADISGFARRQYPVLKAYEDKANADATCRAYAEYYAQAAQDLSWHLHPREPL